MNNRFTWISVKKMIFLLIFIVLLAALIYSVVVYRYIENSKVEDQDATMKFVKEVSEINKITGLDYFIDAQAYDILYGKDVQDKQYIAFNPSGNRDEDNLTLIKLDDVLSKERIEKDWQSACVGCTLKKSSPAMLEDKALWELTYLDKEKRYVMEYISLKDGSTYEKLRMNKKY